MLKRIWNVGLEQMSHVYFFGPQISIVSESHLIFVRLVFFMSKTEITGSDQLSLWDQLWSYLILEAPCTIEIVRGGALGVRPDQCHGGTGPAPYSQYPLAPLPVSTPGPYEAPCWLRQVRPPCLCLCLCSGPHLLLSGPGPLQSAGLICILPLIR